MIIQGHMQVIIKALLGKPHRRMLPSSHQTWHPHASNSLKHISAFLALMPAFGDLLGHGRDPSLSQTPVMDTTLSGVLKDTFPTLTQYSAFFYFQPFLMAHPQSPGPYEGRSFSSGTLLVVRFPPIYIDLTLPLCSCQG